MIDIKEIHQQGHLSIENLELIQTLDKLKCDVGIQMSNDGRIWLCVNGIAFLRFKPNKQLTS